MKNLVDFISNPINEDKVDEAKNFLDQYIKRIEQFCDDLQKEEILTKKGSEQFAYTVKCITSAINDTMSHFKHGQIEKGVSSLESIRDKYLDDKIIKAIVDNIK